MVPSGEDMAAKGGTKKAKAIETLQSLPGVGKTTAEKLFKAGFSTIAKVAGATQTKLVAAGLAASSAKNILKAAKAVHKVKKTATKAKTTAKKSVIKAKTAVKKTTTKAKSTAKKAATKAKTTAKKTATKAKSTAKKSATKAKTTTKKTASKAKKVVSDHGGTGKVIEVPSLKEMLKIIKRD